ncbi:MAG: glycosyltransferase family 2 protein [Chitinophagales bacterium]|nr:glycosyltransferase family 2 protein [Chitinophagales bacterium]MDW8427159.1 glycosyltransferase family 2 protein [Chitinophagales bacterium]
MNSISGISAVIIAFNEEKNIGRCLDSLQGVADEVVVVDSFSTDRTVSICKEKGARVVQHPFMGHVHQKNFALQQATHDWIMSLDADEALDDVLRKALLREKQHPTARAYFVNRLSNFCGKWIRHGAWYPDRKIRFWHKSCGRWGGQDPHDRVVLRPGTSTKTLPGHLLHYTASDVESYRKKLYAYATIAAQAMFEQDRGPIFCVGVRAAWMFGRSYVLRLGFLDGKYGFIIAKLIYDYTYKKYALLGELHRKKSAVSS